MWLELSSWTQSALISGHLPSFALKSYLVRPRRRFLLSTSPRLPLKTPTLMRHGGGLFQTFYLRVISTAPALWTHKQLWPPSSTLGSGSKTNCLELWHRRATVAPKGSRVWQFCGGNGTHNIGYNCKRGCPWTFWEHPPQALHQMGIWLMKRGKLLRCLLTNCGVHRSFFLFHRV